MSYDLYPSASPPFATGMLELSPMQSMYWEQTGNPNGQPIVLLHGGPGAGIDHWQKRLADPHHYRIISFDQRGCGRSIPSGDLRDNTTRHLIDDLELLRRHLGIERWLVFGGSWGSTLALTYAQAYPKCVSGLILRGVFLGTLSEADWFLNGPKLFFPEASREFVEFLPASERNCVLAAYYNRLVNTDPDIHLPAAHSWCRYETRCSTLLPDNATDQTIDDATALILARIQTHYFKGNFFLRESSLLYGIRRIRNIPGIIVQGRYDIICPIHAADRLHRAWPEAQYQIINNAGHSATEPGVRRALVAATELFKNLHQTTNQGADNVKSTHTDAQKQHTTRSTETV